MLNARKRTATATPPDVTRTGRLFAIVSVGEAITWAGLLVGMFLKYVTETTDMWVAVFGRLHGVMFLIYVLVTILAALILRWPGWVAVLAILAAIPPLVTLPLEIWMRRTGLLGSWKTRPYKRHDPAEAPS